MRRTLWVGTPDVVRLMHAAATRKLVGPEHRRTAKLLEENGIDDPEAGSPMPATRWSPPSTSTAR